MLDLYLDRFATAEHVNLIRSIRISPIGTAHMVEFASKIVHEKWKDQVNRHCNEARKQ